MDMDEYVHQLNMKKVLHHHAKSISDSLEHLLPSDVEYAHRCTGGRVGDSDNWIVSLDTYKRRSSDLVFSVEYDTRKPQEIKISSSGLDLKLIQEALDTARL